MASRDRSAPGDRGLGRRGFLLGGAVAGAGAVAAIGVDAAYSLVDEVGLALALEAPAASLSALAARVARQWSPTA